MHVLNSEIILHDPVGIGLQIQIIVVRAMERTERQHMIKEVQICVVLNITLDDLKQGPEH